MSWPSNVQSSTWAALPSATSITAGTLVRCTDYPGPQGGCLLICTGARWRPVSQQHALMNYHNGSSGFTAAAGAAEALFGVARLVKGGMLAVGDHLRLTAYIQQAAASSSSPRRLRVRAATTEGELLSGAVPMLFRTVTTTQYAHGVDRSGIFLSSTGGKSYNETSNSAASVALSLYSMGINDLAADQYIQFSLENGSDQSITVYGATLFVEYGS